jgi:hypothetical protein
MFEEGVEDDESVFWVRDAAASRAASSCLHAERVANSSAMNDFCFFFFDFWSLETEPGVFIVLICCALGAGDLSEE